MILQTERLVLRPFTLQDAAFIVKLLNTAGWLKYIGDRNVKNTADAEKYLLNGPLKSYADNGFGLSAVTLAGSGACIGMCGLIRRAGLDDVDIGFAFLPESEGKGYAFEISTACMQDGFERLKLKRIVAITDPGNKSSISLLTKLGMQFVRYTTVPPDETRLMLFQADKK